MEDGHWGMNSIDIGPVLKKLQSSGNNHMGSSARKVERWRLSQKGVLAQPMEGVGVWN